VADSSLLPVTLGTPALDSVFLAKAGSGLWLISRRPAGLYVRVANNGVAADWTYLGAFPEVNADANWELYNSTDPTKELKFDLSGLPTATIRTVTGPAGNGQMMVSGQAGSFTTLTANNGTLTASAPVLDLAQTWNNAAVSFVGLRFNITNTASAATSNTLVLQNNGTDVFFVRRTGSVIADSFTATSGGAFRFLANASTMFLQRDYVISWSNDATAATGSVTNDLILRRDAAATLGQRDGSNPQAYNLYNTFTSATNHERGFLRWSSNVFQIGTEAGSGGGTARTLSLQSAGNSLLLSAGGGSSYTFFGNGEGVSPLSWVVPATGTFRFDNRCRLTSPADSQLLLRNNASTDFGRLQFGGTTSSFPALKRDSTAIHIRLADDSAFAPLSCGALTLNGNLDASTRNIVTDTTTGTRIGTGTTQLLGFWNATPAAQPAAVADATDAASTQARLNDLLARLRTLGLIAT
jgi:hypothetical protein